MSSSDGLQLSVLESTLTVGLDKFVALLSDDEKQQEQEARPALLAAFKQYYLSRYELGAALAKYKAAFKEQGTWVSACGVIGQAISRSPRTVMRILTDYEQVKGAPPSALKALVAEGYDPAAPRNSTLLQAMYSFDFQKHDQEAAQEAVRAIAENLKRKNRVLGSQEEQQVWKLRVAIRKKLGDIPDSEKKEVLQRAIAEEAFDVWGIQEPFILEIRPRKTEPLSGS